ncbi:hypothetical protein PAXRUDRAFT_28972 [Paxillus rubicundulus Ve08.2h10]|uniref:Unplaced genomic scaffold scaffold_2695, whole genome shotgun sequence n=1 Tax=Paxillus rubicundulus Ve08.2h10 TaxID=930991 RepID=A0A0D0DFC6_9AGAM|nr:hypothetical protein PAXRUDRAFT_28972 [Paxillus rubicundulus Ve08.2h10]
MDDPKDTVEDFEQVNEGMLVESDGTSKMTSWAGEGDGEGTTATKKKTQKWEWDRVQELLQQVELCPTPTHVLNLKQCKNNLDIYHRQEYHDKAQMLISASKLNGDTDVCNGPVH